MAGKINIVLKLSQNFAKSDNDTAKLSIETSNLPPKLREIISRHLNICLNTVLEDIDKYRENGNVVDSDSESESSESSESSDSETSSSESSYTSKSEYGDYKYFGYFPIGQKNKKKLKEAIKSKGCILFEGNQTTYTIVFHKNQPVCSCPSYYFGNYEHNHKFKGVKREFKGCKHIDELYPFFTKCYKNEINYHILIPQSKLYQEMVENGVRGFRKDLLKFNLKENEDNEVEMNSDLSVESDSICGARYEEEEILEDSDATEEIDPYFD